MTSRGSVCAVCVIAIFFLAEFGVVGVETTTFHGDNGARQGYYDTSASLIDDNELKGVITTPEYVVASPVSALKKYQTFANRWYTPGQYHNNEELLAIPSETSLSVYEIEEGYIIQGEDYLRENPSLELLWSYTFKTPIVGTPASFSTYVIPDELSFWPKESEEALFVITTGFYQMTSTVIYEQDVIQRPELFVFNFKTGECFLHTTLVYDIPEEDNHKRVFSSPTYLNYDNNKHFFYFTASSPQNQGVTGGTEFIRVGIVKIGDTWYWSQDGISPVGESGSPFKIYTISSSNEPSYSSPGVVYEMEYKYNNGANSKTLEPYIIQGANNGKLYALHWDDFNLPPESLDPNIPERKVVYIYEYEQIVGKYIHPSPTIFMSKTRSMIDPAQNFDFGMVAYVDIGLEKVPKQGGGHHSYFIRFGFYIEIKQNGGQWDLTLKLEEFDKETLNDSVWVTSSCMIICEYDDVTSKFYAGEDRNIFREFVTGWKNVASGNDWEVKEYLYVIKAEEELERGLGYPNGLKTFSALVKWETHDLTAQCGQFIVPEKPPIIPSPVCGDNRVYFIHKTKVYFTKPVFNQVTKEISDWDHGQSQFYPIVLEDDIGSICYATPALLFQFIFDNGAHTFTTVEFVDVSIENDMYFAFVHCDHLFRNDGYKMWYYEDCQWLQFHKGNLTLVVDVNDPLRYSSMPGHNNFWLRDTDSFMPSILNPWESGDDDQAVASTLAYMDGDTGDEFVISAQKNILACFDENLATLDKPL
jgi:hypothetical protein